MKKFLALITTVILILIAGFYYHLTQQAELSKIAPKLGMKNNKLLPCPESPNCVNSEFKNLSSSVEAIPFPKNYSTLSDLKEKIKILILLNNGNLLSESSNYLHFEFMTSRLKFVDDVEIRFDEKMKLIHIRSASRVGYSDMDANKKRYKILRDIFSKELK